MNAHQSSGFEVVAREDFSDLTYSLEIHHPRMARAARPGQFVIVIAHPRGERVPLTIADFDRDKGTVTLVIQAVGKTTREMQRDCRVGSTLYGVAGPMGVPSRLGGVKKVACVGGGLGVAPIFPLARGFKENGAYVIGIVGFRTESLVFWEHKFRACCDELVVCTDDGSTGMRGLVTDAIKLAMDRHPDLGQVVAVGPPVMMKACAEATRPRNIRTVVSVNPIMVDGTGMCGGCRVRVGGETRFACVDGPEFDAHQVDFDDLMSRLRRFTREERLSLERWSRSCRVSEPAEADEALELPDPFDEVKGG
ncbi:MAG: ferredoxin-NADP reductase [Betaproteobacteria bacterium RIFCSPLOWO2_12_FULL_68_20]|nr:MAG: ferredoxin-NADP reductase [Betaproteobacteria bacterium RIFCSPLOWO2_12_FULL_68_20]